MSQQKIRTDEETLGIAANLVRMAANPVRKLFKQPIAQARKEDRSWVTEADLRSDEILRRGLVRNFPEDQIMSEERKGKIPSGAENVWLVDPLDGTRAYMRGIPGFSILLGLLKEGRPHLGVVFDPLEDRLYEASRGHGAYLTAQGRRTRLAVSTRRALSEMPLAISTDFPEDKLRRIKEVLGLPVLQPINSVGIKSGLIVRQAADIYLSHHEMHFWDTCAPQVIVEEAGGCFTRLDGRSLEYLKDGGTSHTGLTLASNGFRHGELCALFTKIFQ